MTRRVGWTIAALALLSIAALAAAIATLWPAIGVIADPQWSGRVFYLPSESMLPTLAADDRVAPHRVDGRALRRGDVVVYQQGAQARVDRVVGLPGDRVSIHGGRVAVNGRAALIRPLGAGPDLADGNHTRLMRERLIGEAASHLLLDAGASEGDEMAEQAVPAGSVFVLGDNRDRAADSRVSPEADGVGMVSIDHVIGRITAILWSPRSRRWGEPIDAVPLSVARRRS